MSHLLKCINLCNPITTNLKTKLKSHQFSCLLQFTVKVRSVWSIWFLQSQPKLMLTLSWEIGTDRLQCITWLLCTMMLDLFYVHRIQSWSGNVSCIIVIVDGRIIYFCFNKSALVKRIFCFVIVLTDHWSPTPRLPPSSYVSQTRSQIVGHVFKLCQPDIHIVHSNCGHTQGMAGWLLNTGWPPFSLLKSPEKKEMALY